MNAKKISALLLAAAMMAPCAAPVQVLAAEEAAQEASQETEAKTPKYIFLFIGCLLYTSGRPAGRGKVCPGRLYPSDRHYR